jgi:hypothetical protein
MPPISHRTLASAATLALLASVVALGARPCSAGQDWWTIPYPQPFDAGELTMSLDTIRVEGNRFVDASGRTVVFRGVSIADPDKLERQGRWTRGLFEAVREWGANVIRLPVHPVAWRERGREGYFSLLDQAVVWASELELYLMIDWHTIGNVLSGLYQHPMYDTTEQETRAFWRAVAHRYRGVPTIAFYELFNEPTVFNGTLGLASWEEWKAFNEELISIIYAHDDGVIPLVAGFDWAYDLGDVAAAPIERQGIGYVSHPYPQKVEPPYEERWERDFGFVAERYPLFVTEFGFQSADEPDAHVPVVGDQSYGRAILDFLAARGASWAAWCFDPDWGPQLISDWEYTPTASGRFFRAAMQGE